MLRAGWIQSVAALPLAKCISSSWRNHDSGLAPGLDLAGQILTDAAVITENQPAAGPAQLVWPNPGDLSGLRRGFGSLLGLPLQFVEPAIQALLRQADRGRQGLSAEALDLDQEMLLQIKDLN